MPRNKLQDVRDHLIAAMEELADNSEKVSPERMKELKLTNDIGRTLVESAKAEALYIKSMGELLGEEGQHKIGTGFIIQEKTQDAST